MPLTLTPSGAETLYSLSGGLHPTRLSVAYRAGLLVVTVTMLVLPLIYLGLIALAGAAVFWHATQNAWILGGSGNVFWKLLLYVTPVIAGAILIFFMIKPVLARPAKRVDPLPLAREDQPVLFDFIEEICRQVRAPIPSRIQVDCQVNASASFSSLIMSVVRPRFVLTIGLPLAAGLTVRQFGGVLAHEFGHFAQGGGMRLTFVVRSINGWFSRVVNQRDRWDQQLEHWSREADWRVAIPLLIARGSVWCSRQLLTGLMIAGHAISCFMLRQMEYDADSYEIKLVGTGAFIETSSRMRELHVGTQLGYNDLRQDWQHRTTLPSDLPAFLLQRSDRIPPELASQIHQMGETATGYFDTHPSDSDRVQAAEFANSTGIMNGGAEPASALFANFDALSATASRHHYEHDLGLRLDAATFVSADDALQASVGRERRRQATDRFYGPRLNVHRAFIVNLQATDRFDREQLLAGLRAARESMHQLGNEFAERNEAYTQLANTRTLARAAQALIDAGFDKVEPASFGLKQGTLEEAKRIEARAGDELRSLAPEFERFEGLASSRIASAIALLGWTALALDPSTRDAMRAEAARLAQMVNALARTWPNVNTLNDQSMIEGLLLANTGRSPNERRANARFEQTISQIRAALERMRADVGEAPGPSASEDRLATVLQLDRSAKPHGHAGFVVETARLAYFSALGRLAEIALTVEEALG